MDGTGRGTEEISILTGRETAACQNGSALGAIHSFNWPGVLFLNPGRHVLRSEILPGRRLPAGQKIVPSVPLWLIFLRLTPAANVKISYDCPARDNPSC